MTRNPVIGLLPLYLELYDRISPEKRKGFDEFLRAVSARLSNMGIDIIHSRVCRLKNEFREAAGVFKKNGADAVVTIHLAYSPSLEAADVLAESGIPVIIFDTTPDFEFGPAQSPERIMFNHGIHGVQDLCSMLTRKNSPFAIVAGHWKDGGTLERLLRKIQSARIASSFRKSRTGIIGSPFEGMGDFQVAPELVKKLGITVIEAGKSELKNLLESITDDEIRDEIERGKKLFTAGHLNDQLYKGTLLSCLTVRKWAKRKKLTSFTMNFMEFDGSFLPSVPFLEAGMLMAEGLGYAGEGDVLTASLAGAVLSINKKATFTEMFCPDWSGGTIFMSHMGEVNISLLHHKGRLAEKNFPYTETPPPVTVSGRLKSGKAHIVNLAPLGDGKFRLLICRGSIPRATGKDNFEDAVRGWFKPEIPLNAFLEKYSMLGGTHHSVLVYEGETDVFEGFGQFMGWETVAL